MRWLLGVAAMSAKIRVIFEVPSEAPPGIPANGTAEFITRQSLECTRAASAPGFDDSDRLMCHCAWVNTTGYEYFTLKTPSPTPVMLASA